MNSSSEPTASTAPSDAPAPEPWFDDDTMAILRKKALPDDDLKPVQKHLRQLRKSYWGKPNGAVTNGVLHLAYLADGPIQDDEQPYPDIVRLEYERLDIVLQRISAASGPRAGASLVIHGQPGIGKSRCLKYQQAIRFERAEPVIVTDTGRDTFDLYCDEDAFFGLPLALLETKIVVPLRPIVVLVDTDPTAPELPVPRGLARPRKNVIVCLASSPHPSRYKVLSKLASVIAFWVMDLWSDSELHAFKVIAFRTFSHTFKSPSPIFLAPDRRPCTTVTHLPPASAIAPPPLPEERHQLFQLAPAAHMISPQLHYSLTPDASSDAVMVQDPASAAELSSLTDPALASDTLPSLFLPDVASTPPSYIPTDTPHYTFEYLVHMTGRVVWQPYRLLRAGIPLPKTANPPQDVFPGVDLYSAIEALASSRQGSSRLWRPSGFHQAFLEIPMPGVSRPNDWAPKSTIVPASSFVKERLRKRLASDSLTAQAQSAVGLIQHSVIFGIAYEVWAMRYIHEHGLTVTLENGAALDVPPLPTRRLDLSPTTTSSPLHTSSVVHLTSLFASSNNKLENAIYLPTVTNYPALDAVIVLNDNDGNLHVIVLQMTVSSTRPIAAAGVNGLLLALGSFALDAHFHFVLIGPDKATNMNLVKSEYPALPRRSSSELSESYIRNDAVSDNNRDPRLDGPFWTMGFATLDPVPSVMPECTYADVARYRRVVVVPTK